MRISNEMNQESQWNIHVSSTLSIHYEPREILDSCDHIDIFVLPSMLPEFAMVLWMIILCCMSTISMCPDYQDIYSPLI